MNSRLLDKARDFEERMSRGILRDERPAFHLTGGCGWINDPNGFSIYNGEYHLFYQYHPYSNEWGPMHWGHAKSRDLLSWERLPIAMAPDETYDGFGCFSGSALELDDGRHMIMYTGVETIPGKDDRPEGIRQTQCLAFGDGVNYKKYAGNPVLRPEDVPGTCVESDFRDPKIWRDEDGSFYSVMAAMNPDGTSRILLYSSDDGLSWKFRSVLAESSIDLGRMWECPDFFPLDGKYVLMASPMAMMPSGNEFHVGHNTLAIIGEYDKETHTFHQETMQQVDNGIDFYAPQSLRTPDGRRVMIGWMQAWSNSKFVPPGVKYFGQLTAPRELHLRGGRLVQEPVRELEGYRGERVLHKGVLVSGPELLLPGVEGRLLDMTVTVRDLAELKKLVIRVAADDKYHTDAELIPKKGLLRLDRNYSGYFYDIVHARSIPVQPVDGQYKLRFLLDRYSLEVFVNDGERTGTLSLFTPLNADRISFRCEGSTTIDVEKYELRF